MVAVLLEGGHPALLAFLAALTSLVAYLALFWWQE